MKLHVKIGAGPVQYTTAPKLRSLPWVGQSFDVRDQNSWEQRAPLVRVCAYDIKRLDGARFTPDDCSMWPPLYLVERT